MVLYMPQKDTSLMVETYSKWNFDIVGFSPSWIIRSFVHSTFIVGVTIYQDFCYCCWWCWCHYCCATDMRAQFFDFRFPIEFLFVSRFNSPVFRIFHLRFNVYFVYLFIYLFFLFVFVRFIQHPQHRTIASSLVEHLYEAVYMYAVREWRTRAMDQIRDYYMSIQLMLSLPTLPSSLFPPLFFWRLLSVSLRNTYETPSIRNIYPNSHANLSAN